jgi:hypothetical protein
LPASARSLPRSSASAQAGQGLHVACQDGGDIPEAFGWFAAAGEGCNPCGMSAALTAQDLWPLLLKLPHEEQVRLAKLALRAASRGDIQDRHTYQSVPPAADEFAVEEDPLAWEAEGWDEF